MGTIPSRCRATGTGGKKCACSITRSPAASCVAGSATSRRSAVWSCSRTSRATRAARASSTSAPAAASASPCTSTAAWIRATPSSRARTLAWLPPKLFAAPVVLGERRPRLGALCDGRPLQHRRPRHDGRPQDVDVSQLQVPRQGDGPLRHARPHRDDPREPLQLRRGLAGRALHPLGRGHRAPGDRLRREPAAHAPLRGRAGRALVQHPRRRAQRRLLSDAAPDPLPLQHRLPGRRRRRRAAGGGHGRRSGLDLRGRHGRQRALPHVLRAREGVLRRGLRDPHGEGARRAVGSGGREPRLQGPRRRARRVPALRPDDAAGLPRVADDGREPLRRRHGTGDRTASGRSPS